MLGPDGSLCLVKSVMMALPVLFLSALQLPKWAVKEIDRKCRAFLWKGQEEINGGHCLVAWDTICSPIEFGGLGVKNLEMFGQALRLKWLAKELEHKGRPWTMAGWKHGTDVEQIFAAAAQHYIGDGKDTSFWRSHWLPDGPIAWTKPILFSFVNRSKITVAQGLEGHRWVRDIRGSLSLRAMEEYLLLWDELQRVHVQEGQADSIRWKFTADGVFTVASAYELFFCARTVCPYGELIWQCKAPARIRFFLWLVVKGRCLTADNLRVRGWPHNAQCSLCQAANEDGMHLFVLCSFTNRAWRLLRDWVGVAFELPGDSGMSLADWWLHTRQVYQPRFRQAFHCFFMLTCWLIWKERNARIFQQKFKTVQNLVADIKEEVAVWKTAGIFETSPP